MTVAFLVIFVLGLLLVGALLLGGVLLHRRQSVGPDDQRQSPNWGAGLWFVTVALLLVAGVGMLRWMPMQETATVEHQVARAVRAKLREVIPVKKLGESRLVTASDQASSDQPEAGDRDDGEQEPPVGKDPVAEESERLEPNEAPLDPAEAITAATGGDDTAADRQPAEVESLPDWVRTGTQHSGEDLLLTVASRPRMTLEEAEADVRVQARMQLVTEWHSRHQMAKDWEPPREIMDWDKLVIDQHDQIKLIDLGQGRTTPMHILHWRVALTPEVDDSLAMVWKDDLREWRLTWLAGVALLMTFCSALVCVGLRLFKTAASPITVWIAGCLAVVIASVVILAALGNVL